MIIKKRKEIIVAVTIIMLFFGVSAYSSKKPASQILQDIITDSQIPSVERKFPISQGEENPPEIPAQLKYSTSLYHYDRIQIDHERNLAFIAGRSEGFIIMNLTNEESPVVISQFDDNGNITGTGDEVIDLIIGGHFAYLQVGSYGLMILDISDLANPVVVFRYNPYSNGIWGGRSLHLSGNILYFSISDADYAFTFDLLNVADPTQPVIIETGYSGGFYFTQYNNYLITMTSPLKILIYEILEDNTLTLASTIEDFFPNYLDFQIAGDRLYVSAGSIGVRVYDMVDPENPQFLFDFHTDCDFVEEVYIDHTKQGDVIYVADRQGASIYYYHGVAGEDYPILIFNNPLFSNTINSLGNLAIFGAYSLNIYELDIFIDTDEDGMFDLWEYTHGLDYTNSLDANEDLDNDTLTNLEEFTLGTYPESNDTDRDLMDDGWESLYGVCDPLRDDADEDPDEDLLDNLEEWILGTSPESNDTDGDLMPDRWESLYDGCDPTLADGDADPDEDALTNLEEFNAGTSPDLSD
ncbi:MAG: LVIVD repeat-containing protein [Promethearchaeota archaeon]